MNLFEISSDLMLILGKSVQSKNFRVRRDQVEYKVNEKRARAIREEGHRNEEWIDPSWIQNMGRMLVTPVNSGDDSLIPQDCKEIGKVLIPQVVSLPEDRGVYRVSSSSRKTIYYPIEPSRFWDVPPGTVRSKFRYYTRIGRAIYLRPSETEINIDLILDNPLDGYVIRNTNIQTGELTIGDSFTVILGSVVHNGVTYSATGTNVFTAVNADFTGTGTVRYTLEKRKMTNKDPYPLSFTLTDYIVMKILTQDFKIEASNIADIINDSKDQLLTLQPPSQ